MYRDVFKIYNRQKNKESSWPYCSSDSIICERVYTQKL